MQGLRSFVFVSVESFSVPVVLSDLLSPICNKLHLWVSVYSKKPITLVKEYYMPFSPKCIVPVMKLFESSPTGDNLMPKSLNDDVK